MQFREAEEKDLMALAENRWDFEAEYSEFKTSKEGFLNECLKFLKNGLEKGEWVYWIAEENNIVISQIFVCKIVKIPKPQSFFNMIGYVTNVYTKPDYRNKGIGQLLMEHVTKWAQDSNLELLFVWPSNRAVGFYERAGFKSQNDIMELVLKEEI